MTDLHQVVYFRPRLNPSPTKTRTIDCRIGSNLHIVIYLHDSKLRHFNKFPSLKFVSKPIRAKHYARMENHSVAYHATGQDVHLWMEIGVLTDTR